MHVVGEQRLSGGGAGAGYYPVVRAGGAGFAGRAEGLSEGEDVRRRCCGDLKLRLGLIKRDVGKLLRSSEVDGGLSGRVVAPRAYGIEIVNKGCGKTRSDEFAR